MEIGETPTCFWSCQIPFLGSVNLQLITKCTLFYFCQVGISHPRDA